jgi:predicted TIM-barrel fold metal-dependent hydrolase
MMIDAYPHIAPRRYHERLRAIARPNPGPAERANAPNALYELEQRLAIMDQHPGYVQVLTLAGPPIEAVAGPDTSPELAALANDEMAALVEEYPQRFLGFAASLPMNNMAAALRELNRSVEELGASGAQIYSNVCGRPLDRPEFEALFERMAALDLPLWLHPTREDAFSDYAEEPRSKFDIWWAFGWPYETTAAMTHIVFSGVLQRHPDLKIITHHCGALVPYFEGRIRSGLDRMGSRTADAGDREARRRLDGNPVEHFRRFYADTAVSGWTPALECGLAFFGSERVLFGTDMPFGGENGAANVRETIAAVNEMKVTEETRQKIFEGNARRLLRLRLPAS